MAFLSDGTYADSFSDSLRMHGFLDPESLLAAVDDMCDRIVVGLRSAAQATMQAPVARAMHPWISRATLDRIDNRSGTRRRGDRVAETELNRLIRNSVKCDRGAWLNEQAVSKEALSPPGRFLPLSLCAEVVAGLLHWESICH